MMRMESVARIASVAVAASGFTLLSASGVSAHVGGGPVGGFGAGFAHPFGGVDHALVMVAVGLWAAQQGGRAIWAVPTAFVAVLIVGAALGIAGVALPLVAPGIALSLLVVGLLVAGSVRLPLALGVGIAGLTALLHGHAHGVEMPAVASVPDFVAGFVLATIALHATGVAGAVALRHGAPLRWSPVVRAIGLAIVIAGLFVR